MAPCTLTFRYRVVKRACDLILAAALLALCSPFLILLALLIRITSGRPVLYKWDVVGLLGKEYSGYKFRTMIPNAEALEVQLAKFNERKGPAFKMTHDPRITPIGRALRRFSLDELPQLLNILKGEMSFVGPRSLKPREWAAMQDWQRKKFSVVPGAISLWHVSGQPPAFDEWVRLDLQYISSWSLKLDAQILLKGVAYVFSGKNK